MPGAAVTRPPAGSIDGVAPAAPGWFGKLPMLGDFASRRLPAPVVERLDDWLSECLQHAREMLGPQWPAIYSTAPPWRFSWSPGVIDGQWWFGHLVPSRDVVGRPFPLLVARPAARLPASEPEHDAVAAWFDASAGGIAQALSPGATLDSFEHDLAAAGDWPLPPSDAASAPRSHERSAAPGHGLWWIASSGEGSDVTAHRCVGLPGATRFLAMLEGRW